MKNEWLQDAIDVWFFSDSEIEVDERYLLSLSEEDMLGLIWKAIQLKTLPVESLSYFP